MSSWFEDQFKIGGIPALERVFGVTEIVLIRGIDETEPFTARRYDKDRHDKSLETDVTIRVFMLPVEKVAFGANLIEPRTGDYIREGDKIFSILPSESGTPAVTLTTGDLDWEVHTKRIE